MSEDQVELARRCLDGDLHAAQEFVELFQQQVFAICWRMLRHQQDAEDVAQESLLRALRYLGSWDAQQPLAPWVLKIAANRCRTALSKRARRPTASAHGIEQTIPAYDPPAGLSEEVELALARLNENYRRCLTLFYQQEMSIQEVATALDVAEGTVKTWLHRGRKLLAERLRERGWTEEDH